MPGTGAARVLPVLRLGPLKLPSLMTWSYKLVLSYSVAYPVEVGILNTADLWGQPVCGKESILISVVEESGQEDSVDRDICQQNRSWLYL